MSCLHSVCRVGCDACLGGMACGGSWNADDPGVTCSHSSMRLGSSCFVVLDYKLCGAVHRWAVLRLGVQIRFCRGFGCLIGMYVAYAGASSAAMCVFIADSCPARYMSS